MNGKMLPRLRYNYVRRTTERTKDKGNIMSCSIYLDDDDFNNGNGYERLKDRKQHRFNNKYKKSCSDLITNNQKLYNIPVACYCAWCWDMA